MQIRPSHRAIGVQLRDGGNMSAITVADVALTAHWDMWDWWGASEAIIISRLRREVAQSEVGALHDMTLRNVSGVSEAGVVLAGEEAFPLGHITLDGVRLGMARLSDYPGGFRDLRPGPWDIETAAPAALYARHVERLDVKVRPASCCVLRAACCDLRQGGRGGPWHRPHSTPCMNATHTSDGARPGVGLEQVVPRSAAEYSGVRMFARMHACIVHPSSRAGAQLGACAPRSLRHPRGCSVGLERSGRLPMHALTRGPRARRAVLQQPACLSTLRVRPPFAAGGTARPLQVQRCVRAAARSWAGVDFDGARLNPD